MLKPQHLSEGLPLIAHELIHSVTEQSLQFDKDFQREIQSLLDSVKSQSKIKDFYGFKNTSEFLSEAFSSQEFRQLLKDTQFSSTENLSVWQKFVNAILKLFGKNKKYREKTITTNAEQILNSIINQHYYKIGYVNSTIADKINSNQNLSDFISQKSQERLNQIQDVFNENPELSKIGTVEQYNSYLDTIFPDSKMKEIVYHNTDEQFDKFKTTPVAKFFTKSSVRGRKYRLPVLLNTTNPKVFSKFTEDDEMTYGLAEMYAKNKERDGIINGTEGETRTEYVVFEPEQIHVLSSKTDIQGFKDFVQGKQFQKLTAEEKAKTIEQSNTLFGLNTQNQEQLEFHVNTLNVVSQFLENVGIETRLIPEFLSQDGNVVEGAIAAANFIEGTVDIIDDLEKGRVEAWNKLPEEAAHWWYRLLDKNSELKDALLTSALTDRKEEELRNSLYGETYKDGPKVIGKLALDSNGNVTSKPALSAIREEAIGQLIAEAIKRIETKNAAPEDYSFFKKFLEWINSIIDAFKNTTQDPFEVAAMKILSSDMSDLMTWEEYRKVNNIVNFADVLTEQSVAPVDYTLIEDIGFIGSTFMEDNYGNATSGYRFHFKDSNWVQKYGNSSPSFYTQQELDNWVSVNIKEHDIRQKQQIQEVRDNQIFFDRLLNKTFRKKSKFLPKTL